METKKVNWTFAIVAKAVELFDWPKSTLSSTALHKELKQAKLCIDSHVLRLFPELDKQDSIITKTHRELAAKDLLSLLDELKTDQWWSMRMTSLSMLDKYVVAQLRQGKKRTAKDSKKIDSILERF